MGSTCRVCIAVFIAVLLLQGIGVRQAPLKGGGDGIVYLAVVIHMNQLLEDLNVTEAYGRPAGEVFYNESLIPLNIPGVKLVVDITGPTIISMLASNPSILENLREGVREGRVEILGISFGQIPLQYLPYRHVYMHIYYENKLLEEIFNVKPRGVWQEDRQWSPELPYIISRLGFQYTLIDDNVYLRGNPDSDPYSVYYPHIAAYNESEITVFHISKYMRYHLRDTGSVEDIVKYLDDIRKHTSHNNIPPIVVYGDDAEFGLNPYVLKKLAETPWIRFTTLSEYLDKYGEHLTRANYNVYGAYPEYESMHGREWYKWYSRGIGRRLYRIFSRAGEEIMKLEEKRDLGWLIDASWITLLLGEWQYGHFYKMNGESNIDYLVDTYTYTLAGLNHGNKSKLVTETINLLSPRRIAIYVDGQWGLGIDLDHGSIRSIIDFKNEKIITPLRYFNTEKWWKFTEPHGITLGKTFRNVYMQGNKLVLETGSGDTYLVETGNDTVEIICGSCKTENVVMELDPGGYYNYIFPGEFPKYHASMNGSIINIMDSYGNCIVLNGLKHSEIYDHRFSIYIAGEINRTLKLRIGECPSYNGGYINIATRSRTTTGRRMEGGVGVSAILVAATTLVILIVLILYVSKIRRTPI